MSGYVKQLHLVLDFEGRKVNIKLLPMRRGDLFRLQAMLPRDPDNPDKLLLSHPDAVNAFDSYASMLRDHYVKEHDLTDAAGNPLETAEWVESAYHSPLITLIMMRHMEASSPANPPSSAAVPPGSSS